MISSNLPSLVAWALLALVGLLLAFGFGSWYRAGRKRREALAAFAEDRHRLIVALRGREYELHAARAQHRDLGALLVQIEQLHASLGASQTALCERDALLDRLAVRLVCISEGAQQLGEQLITAERGITERDLTIQQLHGQVDELCAQVEADRQRLDEIQKLIVDDLTVIRGIGPVYLKKLRAAGLRRYQDLAQASPQELDAILQAPRWRRPDYIHWIEQAKQLVG
jgi:predicted flap endonuclease-1-like 5' DNA nuclease